MLPLDVPPFEEGPAPKNEKEVHDKHTAMLQSSALRDIVEVPDQINYIYAQAGPRNIVSDRMCRSKLLRSDQILGCTRRADKSTAEQNLSIYKGFD